MLFRSIGTGAVVTKDVPAWSVAVGFPAKVIRVLQEREDNILDISNTNGGN